MRMMRVLLWSTPPVVSPLDKSVDWFLYFLPKICRKLELEKPEVVCVWVFSQDSMLMLNSTVSV